MQCHRSLPWLLGPFSVNMEEDSSFNADAKSGGKIP